MKKMVAKKGQEDLKATDIITPKTGSVWGSEEKSNSLYKKSLKYAHAKKEASLSDRKSKFLNFFIAIVTILVIFWLTWFQNEYNLWFFSN